MLSAVHTVMSTRSKQMVVAYDYSAHSEAACDYAITLACKEGGIVLHFVVALDPKHGAASVPVDGKVDFAYAERVQKHLAEQLRNLFAARQSEHEINFFVHSRIGAPADQILNLAADVAADQIVIGSHGRTGVERFFLGSVSERVVREAKCPVVVMREKTYHPVELMKVTEVPEHAHHYAQPHRYSYTGSRMITRPGDWPLW